MTGRTTDAAALAAAKEAGEAGFDALIAELGTLAKALPADGGKADAEEEEVETEGQGEGEGGEEEESPLGKSFGVTLADGSSVEAYDATAVLTALQTENTELKGEVSELKKALAIVGGLTKSLHGANAELGALVKSLQADVKRFGNAGAGRKTVVAAPPAPEKPKGQPYPDVMAKALSLQGEGKLSGMDVSRLVAHTGRGLGIPEDMAHLFTA